MTYRKKDGVPPAVSAYMADMGRRGGKLAAPSRRGLAGNREAVKLIAELNRVRRKAGDHVPECRCEACTRYRAALDGLRRLREAR